LYTPHRMAYIAGAVSSDDCPFCVLPTMSDEDGLVVHRGEVAYAVLNLYLHQHLVPRWGGDTNFMPVVGQTKVLPQLLPETRELLAKAWLEV
jgi:diadenosine tetraphosphate (Ap4A) HIT family hydrolase